ncbi:hypothetical protein [Microbaculum sp. FT89]|uniref:hypothetical protein n=1 Tax=Microbaculum sp. FT89 TaxID=3447298 RepID=UPI003F52BFF9
MIARKAKVIAPLAFLVVALAGPAAAKSGIPLTGAPVLDQEAGAVILAVDKKKAATETKQGKKQTADNPDQKKKKKKKAGKKNKKKAAG